MWFKILVYRETGGHREAVERGSWKKVFIQAEVPSVVLTSRINKCVFECHVTIFIKDTQYRKIVAQTVTVQVNYCEQTLTVVST